MPWENSVGSLVFLKKVEEYKRGSCSRKTKAILVIRLNLKESGSTLLDPINQILSGSQ